MYFPCTVKSVMHPEAGTASPEGCVLVQIGDEASVLKRDSPYPVPHGVASFSTIGADWTLLELNALTVPQDSVTSISLRVDKQGTNCLLFCYKLCKENRTLCVCFHKTVKTRIEMEWK